MAKKTGNFAELLQKYSAEKDEEMIPTGVLPIDDLFGGGINPGSMYALWGTAGSGKSTIALQIVKAFCKRGDKCVWIDTEKALNKKQQEAFGVREYVENGLLLHVTADTYVQADEICMGIAGDPSQGIKLVVIDSETQLMPKLGEDYEIDSNQPGVKARQAASFLMKTKASFYNVGIASIILSHARANLNMQSLYSPKEQMAGGYALKHVPDAILQILPGQKVGTDKLAPVGVVLHLSCDKCKFSAPFRRLDATLYYGQGIKKSVYLIDWAIANGIIEQKGAYFTVNGESIRGTDALYSMSNEHLSWLLTKYNETLKS